MYHRMPSNMVIFPDDHQNQPANNINNQRYNPSLLNHRDILIVVLYMNISLLLRIFLLPTYGILVTFLVLMIHAIHFHSLFYCFNSKLRQFYLRKFWEKAPSCLQFLNPDRIIETNNTDNNIELGPLPRKRYSKKRHVRARPSKKRSRF